MAFYEAWHSMDPEYYVVERGENLSYPLHTHYCYEIISVVAGEMSVTVDGNTFVLRPGMFALIFPNQLHSIMTEKNSRHTLCIFSPEMVGRYTKHARGRCPTVNFFDAPGEMSAFFLSMKNGDSIYTVKGILYLIFGQFASFVSLQDHKEPSRQVSLLYSMLHYIQENCYGECSLRLLAQKIKYDYSYLSKFFVETVGVPFHAYVTMLRVNHACYLLHSTDDTVLSISAACGFDSLRTFNRNFLHLTGNTPAMYRKKEE